MRSHFSKNHKKQDVDSLKEEIVCQDQTAFEDDSVENVRIDEEEPEVVYDAEAGEDDPVTITDDEQDAAEEIDEFFMRSLAVCINTWMNISGIPYSTVNQIVKEIFNSYEKGADVTKSKVKAVLQREGVSVATIENVLKTLERDDPFKKAKNELESEFKRKMYIKEHFANVEPVTVVLSAANEKVESYQYVPIKESLKLLVEDETYIVQRKNDPYCHKEGQIADARDGTKMTNNIFFKQNPEAVPLLIFEDELEVANPLGSAKTKHKINCCYYTTLHVQSALRGRVKSIQLVSLISSKTWKKYGNIEANKLLLSDLKDLENEGIGVQKPFPMVIKAGVAAFVGDNLGAHHLAEMSCSFSSGPICRMCKATYKDVCENFIIILIN